MTPDPMRLVTIPQKLLIPTVYAEGSKFFGDESKKMKKNSDNLNATTHTSRDI